MKSPATADGVERKRAKKRRLSAEPVATSTPMSAGGKRVSFGGTHTRKIGEKKRKRSDVSTVSLDRTPAKSILKQCQDEAEAEPDAKAKKKGKASKKRAKVQPETNGAVQSEADNSRMDVHQEADGGGDQQATTSKQVVKKKRKIVVTKKDKERLATMTRQERRAFTKELRAKRKPYYDIAKRAKVLWEVVRNTKKTKEERKKSANELFDLVKGRALQLLFAHDTTRIFQCLLSVGRTDIRDQLFDEVRSQLPRLVKSKYAKHFVAKMLKHGTESQRAEIMRAFSGRALELYRSADLADVVENAYNNYANAKQRSDIACEFYTADHAALKEEVEPVTIEQMLKDDKQKETVVQRLSELLHTVSAKPALRYSLTHRLLYEYMSHASVEQRTEMVDAIKERLVEIVHTRDGAWAALLCLWHATAKERKIIVKSTKDVVVQLCADEHGSLFLLGLLDAVDDTVLVKKTVVKEISAALPDVLKTMSGLRVANHLVRRRDARYLQKEQRALLLKADESAHTKKESTTKTHELYAAAAPHVMAHVAKNMEELIFDKSKSVFVLNCLEAASIGSEADATDLLPLCPPDGRRQCYDALATLASAEFVPANFEERLHLVEHANSHFVLAKLLKLDKAINGYNNALGDDAVAKRQPLLTDAIVEKLAMDQVAEWTACNKGCFVLTYMLTCGSESAASVRTVLRKSYMSKLKEASTAGAKALLNALDA